MESVGLFSIETHEMIPTKVSRFESKRSIRSKDKHEKKGYAPTAISIPMGSFLFVILSYLILKSEVKSIESVTSKHEQTQTLMSKKCSFTALVLIHNTHS